MADDRIAQLLRGYRLPAPSAELDRRVLADAATILAREPAPPAWDDVAHAVLQRSGFAVLAWLIDLATGTDAEYRVAVI